MHRFARLVRTQSGREADPNRLALRYNAASAVERRDALATGAGGVGRRGRPTREPVLCNDPPRIRETMPV